MNVSFLCNRRISAIFATMNLLLASILLASLPLRADNCIHDESTTIGRCDLNIKKHDLSRKSINITDCNFKKFNLSGLNNIIDLYARNNKLTYVEGTLFKDNIKLQYIDLSNNDINTIEDGAFKNLFELEEINLAYNKIRQIDENVFAMNLKLININLSYNLFRSIQPLNSSARTLLLRKNIIEDFLNGTFFNQLVNIKYLDLSQNNLVMHHISKSLHSSTLRKFDLSNNKITELHNNTFRYLRALEILYINDNQLTDMSLTHFFKYNENLKELYLDGNPFLCDCKRDDICERYKFINARTDHQLKCINDNKRSWDSLNLACSNEIGECNLESTSCLTKNCLAFMIIVIFIMIISLSIYFKDKLNFQRRASNIPYCACN